MSDDTHDDPGTVWADRPTIKQRTAVQHAVERLLDDLAPERAPPRADIPTTAVQRHRTPRGCILQAAGGAVSVSWFPASTNDDAYGELQVIAWRGVVSRPGSSAARRAGAAVSEWQLVLQPVEVATSTWGWRDPDGSTLDAAALTARVNALLAERMTSDAVDARAS
jgi:hypothetical protein